MPITDLNDPYIKPWGVVYQAPPQKCFNIYYKGDKKKDEIESADVDGLETMLDKLKRKGYKIKKVVEV